MPTRRALIAGFGSIVFAGCSNPLTGPGDTATPVGAGAGSPSLALRSPAFDDGESIPTAFTADGADESPPLRIEGVPDDAESLALVVDDPDAPSGRFVHWLLWNVPPDTTEVPRGLPGTDHLASLGDARQGTNGFGNLGYDGPAPPAGDGPHTYAFTLTALDTTLDVEAGAERDSVDDAMADHVLTSAQLTGTYDR